MPGPKILGQVTGTGTGTNVLVYTSPTTTGAGGTAISTIALINTSTGSQQASVFVTPSGTASPSTVHTLYPLQPVQTGDLITITIGVSLEPGAKIYIAAETGIQAHVYGTEL